MAKKLWGGRFGRATHPLLEAFSASLSLDRELAEADVEGSLAHARMLLSGRFLTSREFLSIQRGLKAILADLRKGRFPFRASDEDIHMAVEAALTRRIGASAKKLHTARSRNDQVATDLRLWCRRAVDRLDGNLLALMKGLLACAQKNAQLVIPGYTHLQRAQPVLLAQHLLAYVEMLERDRGRLADCRRRLNRLPLGSGALAGTTLKIDRERVQRDLGFDGLCENSMDAVSDRDFAVELLAALALLMAHLSRFSEDLVLWASGEWGLVRLADEWSTGSSLMPQKRNPDLLELVRGKTGRVYGDLFALLTILKGLPLAYNRDLQEDKRPLFDGVKTALASTKVLAAFVPSLKFDRKAAARLLEGGFLDATAAAEYLVKKKLSFREAHEVVGGLVKKAEARGAALKDLPLKEWRAASPLFQRNILHALDPAQVVRAYSSAGSAGTKEVQKALARWEARLGIAKKAKNKKLKIV
ncbi:MAG: argininosuccinate lyase [Planctomycetota bacterium]